MRVTKQAAAAAASTFPALYATEDGKTVILATGSVATALSGTVVQTDDSKYGAIGSYRASFPRPDFVIFDGTVTLAN